MRDLKINVYMYVMCTAVLCLHIIKFLFKSTHLSTNDLSSGNIWFSIFFLYIPHVEEFFLWTQSVVFVYSGTLIMVDMFSLAPVYDFEFTFLLALGRAIGVDTVVNKAFVDKLLSGSLGPVGQRFLKGF